MKCPMCNGSGKCYEQKIRYQEIETNRTDFVLAKCHKCNGTGKIGQTEQEYIQSCNHKELTEILFRMIVNGSVIRPDRQYISEWLKQPHREE